MPYPEVLDGRPGLKELDEQHAFPEWTDRAMLTGYLTVAVLTGVTSQVESRWLFCGLLALAVLPAAIALVRPMSAGTFAFATLVPLSASFAAPSRHPDRSPRRALALARRPAAARA